MDGVIYLRWCISKCSTGIVTNNLVYPLMMKCLLEMDSLGIQWLLGVWEIRYWEWDWICLKRWIEVQMIHWKLSMKCSFLVFIFFKSDKTTIATHRMWCGNWNNACEYMHENVLMCRSSMTYWKRTSQHGRQWFRIRVFFLWVEIWFF